MDKNDIAVTRYRLDGSPKVSGVGRVKLLAIHPDRVLDYWVLGVMTDGRMPIRIGEVAATLEAGEYFLLPPDVRHYGTERIAFSTVWMHFEMPGAKLAAGEISGGIVLPVVGRVPPGINYLSWGLTMKQSLDSGWMSLDEAGVQVAAILGQLALEGRRRFPQSPEAQIALGAMDILIAAYREPPSAPELADALGYSYGHVARAFRSHFGMTIRQKLTEIRVKEAVSLISMGASLKEAAAETGFNDYYYFLRVFTKTTGTSPGRAATEGGLRPPKRK